ncbi:hypothetical protein AV530_005096 [Patagioenas fasciata monilis]|uniref:Uncharacterized protein n=1 Tax=Patagioenas fasciata monilis TaxID=372326 RepID=A0A1V4K3Y9_PATFA|nr:hypothetical protein AV530_005096 [Patagioenas fasciata monilis]
MTEVVLAPKLPDEEVSCPNLWGSPPVKLQALVAGNLPCNYQMQKPELKELPNPEYILHIPRCSRAANNRVLKEVGTL